MKRTRYADSKKHCMDLNSLLEHGRVKYHTLFIKYFLDGKLILLLFYIDDMIIPGNGEIEKLTLKEKLAT
ncbi:hypothetical protein CR513_05772, partial [Mucuna pruriens]